MLYVIFIVVFPFPLFTSLDLCSLFHERIFTQIHILWGCGLGGWREVVWYYMMKAIASDSERVHPITVEFIAIMRRSKTRQRHTHTHHAHISQSSTHTCALILRPIVRHWSKHMQRLHTFHLFHLSQSWARAGHASVKCENVKFMSHTRILTSRPIRQYVKHGRSMRSHAIKSKFLRNVSNHTNDDCCLQFIMIKHTQGPRMERWIDVAIAVRTIAYILSNACTRHSSRPL